MLAVKIAWRNICKHRGKSLVIGVILFFGAVLMTVGNGIIAGMNRGLSENIVKLFTGDLVVISNQQEKDSVLLDVMGGKPLKVIKDYPQVKKYLGEQELIKEFLPVTAGLAFVLNGETESGNKMLLGVDIKRYLRFFPDSITIEEGRLLHPGERGILVSAQARRQDYKFRGYWLLPEGEELDQKKLPLPAKEQSAELLIKRELVLMGADAADSAVDIRVPIKGIIEYRALKKVWGLYNIIDIESYRETYSYVTGADSLVEISREGKDLLANEQLDQYFAGGNMFAEPGLIEEGFTLEDIQQETKKEITGYDLDAGAYNLVLLKLKDGGTAQVTLQKLNEFFRENRLEVRAVSWKDAIGTLGSMTALVKTALNVFIIFIFFVAIIVIINTLSMTALERVSELAMMRAIGARKGFLRRMFILETAILSVLFGGLGIIIGIAVIYLLRLANITTTNEILQMVYGGEKLSPFYSWAGFRFGVLQLGVVTLLAVLYPLRVVGKIIPLDAMSRE